MKNTMEKGKKILIASSGAALSLLMPLASFASEVQSSTPAQMIVKAANDQKADAAAVIGGAIGLGIVFWGAQVLWSKFKSMAK